MRQVLRFILSVSEHVVIIVSQVCDHCSRCRRTGWYPQPMMHEQMMVTTTRLEPHICSGTCTKTRNLNIYRASLCAIHICDHAIMNYCKKYFRARNADKIASFGSEIAWIQICEIQNSQKSLYVRFSVVHHYGITLTKMMFVFRRLLLYILFI